MSNKTLTQWVETYATAMKLAERYGNEHGDMDAANNAWHECKKFQDALEAADKRIAELEQTNCSRLDESERKLAVARKAIQQTIAENGHLADGEVCTLKSLKEALAQIGGDE